MELPKGTENDTRVSFVGGAAKAFKMKRSSVIGMIVLRQVSSRTELLGVALVIAGIAVHREHERQRAGEARRPGDVLSARHALQRLAMGQGERR
jgi:hypothetical protein